MNENLIYFAKQIKGFQSCYLAGGIEKRLNPNSWRVLVEDFLKKNNENIRIFNPVDDNKHILHNSILGYKENGEAYTLDELRKMDENKMNILFKQMELNDFNFISRSDLIIFYFDESAGFGTYTEFKENCDKYKKPSIIVRTIARNDLHPWVEWRRFEKIVHSRNIIEFKNFTEMRLFFIKQFNYKE